VSAIVRPLAGQRAGLADSGFVSAKRRRRKAGYSKPAGGWGSAKAVGTELLRERVVLDGTRLLLHQNKSDGFACVSCAWAKPRFRPLEFCENGAKATLWEADAHRTTPDFFAEHSVAELLTWSDHRLEAQGRLTHPLRWDKERDKYIPVQWEQAFDEIGAILRASDPRSAVFYALGAPPWKQRTCLHSWRVFMDQQSTRLFEHVSRKYVGRASRQYRRPCGDSHS